MPQQAALTLDQLDLYRRERLALSKLTEKQKTFCEVYVRTFNKLAALKEAGYFTPKYTGGSQDKLIEHDFERVINAPQVQEYIHLLKQSVASRLGFSMDDIVDEFKSMAFTNMDDYVTWTNDGMTLKSSSQLTRAQKAGILEIKETSNRNSKVVTIKLHNKQPALEKLFEVLKELEEHEAKVDGPAKITQVQINTILMDPVKRRSIEHLAESLYDKQVALVGTDKQRVEFEERMAKITQKMLEVQNGIASGAGDGDDGRRSAGRSAGSEDEPVTIGEIEGIEESGCSDAGPEKKGRKARKNYSGKTADTGDYSEESDRTWEISEPESDGQSQGEEESDAGCKKSEDEISRYDFDGL